MKPGRDKRFRKLAMESLESRRVMASLPFGAEADDTGEFMLGRIAVTPVFLESDGSIDPSTENWTPGHISSVLNNIQTGLNWWTQLLATKSDVHTLEWVIDTTFATTPKSTPYEPIARNSNAYALWVSRFLSDVGFSDSSNLETNVRSFNNAQRTKLGTDWSFTIFVVNSVNDGDGSFAPGGSFSRAFAFAGGLFEVVPSTRPASTFTHETGHLFWARDEYTGGGNYYQKRGYYNSQNTNAIDLNPTQNFQQSPSIMSAGSVLQTAYDTLTTADATLAQIGWQDSDGDGVFDVLDVPLKLEGTGRLNQDTGSYRFVGRASVQTLPNKNSSGLQNDITLNRISRIEYRINEGAWQTYSSPNSYTVDIDLNIPLTTTQGKIEIRAIDSRIGIVSNIFTGTLGPIPDVTTRPGIQGFVWNDEDGNGNWTATENGLAGMSVTLVDAQKQPLVLQTIIEPDSYTTGMFNNPVSGIRLDVIGDDATGNLGIFEDPDTSTGTKIFKPFSMSVGNYIDAFKGNSQQFRARLDNPTTYVSIDAIALTDNTDVRLDAYSADGVLIKRFERKGMLSGQKVTMEVGTDSPQIASIIARGFDNSFVKLDNFRYGPKSTSPTASDGSYFLPYLPAGTYNVLVQPNALGYRFTAPVTGLQTVVLASAGVAAHQDFGINREPSPWQNPRLAEDVDNSTDVGPLDVLVLINEINKNQSRPLDNSGLTTPPYYDVNGDRIISPLDVLQVINFLNRRSSSGGGNTGGGEGEIRTALGGGTTATTAPAASQAPFLSFVIDAKREMPNTWIIQNSSERASRMETGAERCGCPACTSFEPSGESSPAILDITTAIASSKQDGDRDAQSVLSSELDAFLAEWNV